MNDKISIEIDKNLFDRLSEMAKEVTTQDPRGTRKPYFFQIRETVRELGYSPGFSDDWDWVLEDSPEISFGPEDEDAPEELQNCDDYDDEVEVTNEDGDCEVYRKVYWKETERYSGAFLRESSVKDHIRRNHYHYSDPVDYLQAGFRNPDLELLFEFLETLNAIGK